MDLLVPAENNRDMIQSLHGCMRGSVTIPDGVDLTASTVDEAELDALNRYFTSDYK